MACPTCCTSEKATSNIQHRTSNVEVIKPSFDVRCSMFSVRCSIERPRRRAFGLAEALMASTVLAIAVVGLSVQLSAAHQQAGAVREHNTAVLLAKQLLEE